MPVRAAPAGRRGRVDVAGRYRDDADGSLVALRVARGRAGRLNVAQRVTAGGGGRGGPAGDYAGELAAAAGAGVAAAAPGGEDVEQPATSSGSDRAAARRRGRRFTAAASARASPAGRCGRRAGCQAPAGPSGTVGGYGHDKH